MSNASMTPGSRPRKGIVAIAALALGVAATTLALGVDEATSPPRVAGASELVTFTSCDDLAAWGREAQGSSGGEILAADAAGASAAPAASTTAGPVAAETAAATEADDSGRAGSSDGATVDGDATNVDVAGVDELDLIDQLGDDRVLVASASRLAIVDLAAPEVVASRTVPYDAQVTYDDESGIAWVVGHDEDGGGVTVDRVAVTPTGLDGDDTWTTAGQLVDARRVGGELHLVAVDGFAYHEFPEGDVGTAPPGAAEDLDAGVSSDATGEPALPFTGGPVPCDQVLHPEGPSDPVATLLVTLPATGTLEPTRAAQVVGAGEQVHVTLDAAYLATPEHGDEGTTTGIHRFDLATLTPTGSGRVEGRMLDQFSMSELDGHLRVAVTTDADVMGGVAIDDVPATTILTEPTEAPIARNPITTEGEVRNEVVVLDTDGALDVVGRTPRFGKPGESIHGIRFAGDVAYAVTFLTTDPFYVIDLSTPTAPRIQGEVELPGFSSYLHPLADGLVVGFGPGDDGRATAKLFDVSDPTAPRVADSLALGDESAVTGDHHAFVDLGDGRFAVPAITWRDAFPGSAVDSAVVVIDTAGRRLSEAGREAVETIEPATRALPAGDGWALLAGSEIVVLDVSGGVRATLRLT